jgi:hypothetical protein
MSIHSPMTMASKCMVEHQTLQTMAAMCLRQGG